MMDDKRERLEQLYVEAERRVHVELHRSEAGGAMWDEPFYVPLDIRSLVPEKSVLNRLDTLVGEVYRIEPGTGWDGDPYDPHTTTSRQRALLKILDQVQHDARDSLIPLEEKETSNGSDSTPTKNVKDAWKAAFKELGFLLMKKDPRTTCEDAFREYQKAIPQDSRGLSTFQKLWGEVKDRYDRESSN